MNNGFRLYSINEKIGLLDGFKGMLQMQLGIFCLGAEGKRWEIIKKVSIHG